MLNKYEINNTINLDQHGCYKKDTTFPEFQDKLVEFKNLIKKLVSKGENKTFYKFGDGDYYFLKKMPVGSAAPGRRAISVSYNNLKTHSQFVQGVGLNDYQMVEIYPENIYKFKEIYPFLDNFFPAEYVYGLVSNKWLLKTFKGHIGLIGAKEKINLIETLMTHQSYQEYLGIDKFNDYLHIPQQFACDNIDEVEKSISQQLLSSSQDTKIFLVGIGHVKSALLHRLKKYKNAIFLDVGSGIDALAGVIDYERPYMGAWINYKLKNFDYGTIDLLQYKSTPERESWL